MPTPRTKCLWVSYDTNLKHIKKIDNGSELQAGFTENRSITDNLYVLKYCISETYKIKKKLIVTSLDYGKAFDSVDRASLIKTLMINNIHSKLINIIAQIYTDDETDLM